MCNTGEDIRSVSFLDSELAFPLPRSEAHSRWSWKNNRRRSTGPQTKVSPNRVPVSQTVRLPLQIPHNK